jgi:beta-aspartyl-dipeptidase (metallo-type)
VFHAHLGLRRAPAAQLAAVIERSDLPPDGFVATHVNYGPETLAAAPDLARIGAWIDVTSVLGPWSAARESIKASAAVRRFLDAGVPLSRISISSDANASVPQVDAPACPSGKAPDPHPAGQQAPRLRMRQRSRGHGRP